MELACNPEAQQKLQQELEDFDLLCCPRNPNPRQIEWEDLNKLTFLNSVRCLGSFLISFLRNAWSPLCLGSLSMADDGRS